MLVAMRCESRRGRMREREDCLIRGAAYASVLYDSASEAKSERDTPQPKTQKQIPPCLSLFHQVYKPYSVPCMLPLTYTSSTPRSTKPWSWRKPSTFYLLSDRWYSAPMFPLSTPVWVISMICKHAFQRVLKYPTRLPKQNQLTASHFTSSPSLKPLKSTFTPKPSGRVGVPSQSG